MAGAGSRPSAVGVVGAGSRPSEVGVAVDLSGESPRGLLLLLTCVAVGSSVTII